MALLFLIPKLICWAPSPLSVTATDLRHKLQVLANISFTSHTKTSPYRVIHHNYSLWEGSGSLQVTVSLRPASPDWWGCNWRHAAVLPFSQSCTRNSNDVADSSVFPNGSGSTHPQNAFFTSVDSVLVAFPFPQTLATARARPLWCLFGFCLPRTEIAWSKPLDLTLQIVPGVSHTLSSPSLVKITAQ